MACSKLEARGHLLHKTGTRPKQISRECIQTSNTLKTLSIHYKSPLIFKYFFSVTRTQNWSKIWSFFSSGQGEKKRLCKSDEHTVQYRFSDNL